MAYQYVASDLLEGDVQHHPFFSWAKDIASLLFSLDHIETDNMSLNEKINLN
jgi:hypothetical protein